MTYFLNGGRIRAERKRTSTMSHERLIEIVRIRSEQGAARRGRVIEEYRIGKTSRIDYIALFSSCFLSDTNDEQTSKTVLSRIPMGAMDSGSGGG